MAAMKCGLNIGWLKSWRNHQLNNLNMAKTHGRKLKSIWRQLENLAASAKQHGWRRGETAAAAAKAELQWPRRNGRGEMAVINVIGMSKRKYLVA
jgi:hypothetical protein